MTAMNVGGDEAELPSYADSITSQSMIGDIVESTDAVDDDDDDVDEQYQLLQRAHNVQEEEIKKLQLELNEAHVKHGKESYWLRLELDSIRREKETAEDRMTELYHDVQEILLPAGHVETRDGCEETAGTQNQTTADSDLVIALKDRLSAYEKSVEILNRQIDMIKTSSEAVVVSMKTELTDLMADKSQVELELLNQISNLHNEKQKLEMELEMARSGSTNTSRSTGKKEMDAALFNETKDVSKAVFPSEFGALEAKPSRGIVDEDNDNLAEKATESLAPSATQDTSFPSTAVTEGSYTMNETSVHTQGEDNLEPKHLYSMGTKSLRDELAKYQSKAKRAEEENQELQGKLKELTKDLMYTRSSASVALALDKIKTNQKETLTHLDRITMLWDRADDTVQVLEGLLSDVAPPEGVGKVPNKTEQDQLLSTLEIAALVHGQIKMSLMHIELAFRNQLASVKDDNLKYQQDCNEDLFSKLDTVRSETLTAISEAEDKWQLAIEHLETQIMDTSKSTNDAIKLQIDELQKAQSKQQELEKELRDLKTPLSVCTTTDTIANDGTLPKKETDLTSLLEGESKSSAEALASGITVSPGVLFRLQQEVLLVVERLKEKNQLIEVLTRTIARHKSREVVLKQELKRAKRKTNSGKTTRNVTAQDKIGDFDSAQARTSLEPDLAELDFNLVPFFTTENAIEPEKAKHGLEKENEQANQAQQKHDSLPPKSPRTNERNFQGDDDSHPLIQSPSKSSTPLQSTTRKKTKKDKSSKKRPQWPFKRNKQGSHSTTSSAKDSVDSSKHSHTNRGWSSL